MSHDTYEEHLKRGGVPLDPVRIDAFRAHRRTCPTCANILDFGYLDCPEGLRLARAAVQPIDKS